MFVLTKPWIVSATVLAAAAGYVAGRGRLDTNGLWSLVGIALSAASACALNMHQERLTDRLMQRTCDRPLASRRMPAWLALALASAMGIAGLLLLAAFADPLTVTLSLVALVLYVWVYTPLKRHTPSAFLVGILPGALPPLMGWTAATGRLGGEGLWLFAVLAAWQVPHVLALSTYLADDYARAGIRVAPPALGHRATVWVSMMGALAMMGLSLGPWIVGPLGALYAVAALVAGAWFTTQVARGFQAEKKAWGRRCFVASLAYIGIYFVSVILEKMLQSA